MCSTTIYYKLFFSFVYSIDANIFCTLCLFSLPMKEERGNTFLALMLHNARETMLEITVTGWETGRVGVRVRGSRIILLSSSFNLFEHHQKECLCPENQIDTHREQTPFWLISIITITTTTLPLGCRSFTFRVSDEDIDIEEEPKQRRYANNYTSMSHFYGCHFMPYLGRRPSCSGRT